jgi:[ribosomal protein S18]-alanine N-acetyltransferase
VTGSSVRSPSISCDGSPTTGDCPKHRLDGRRHIAGRWRSREPPTAAARGRDSRSGPASAEAQLKLRLAQVGDLPRIAEIEALCFSDPWSLRSFRAVLGDRRVYFALAEVAGRVAGYVVAWFVHAEGEIANLAVAPEARGGRIGSALLDSAINAARGRGVATIYLEVRDSNSTARRLYASRGFVEVGRRRDYYRNPMEDALVLRANVAAPEPEGVR